MVYESASILLHWTFTFSHKNPFVLIVIRTNFINKNVLIDRQVLPIQNLNNSPRLGNREKNEEGKSRGGEDKTFRAVDPLIDQNRVYDKNFP